MSKFNLNENTDNGIIIFNNGVAGKVENVSIDIEKKKLDEPDTYPDYKLVVNDGSGSMPLTSGFKREEQDDNKQIQSINRIKSIASAILPDDFVYPEVNSYTEAVDTLMKIIKDNSEGKKVNVFTSYGYQAKPSKYLGLRFFNFIEKPDVKFSRLKASPTDVLERMTEDAPKTDEKAVGTSNWTL